MGQLVILRKWGTNWKNLGERFGLWNNGERASRGVEIHFNIHEGVVIKEDKKDNDGRMLFCEIKIENQIYNLLIYIVQITMRNENISFYLSIYTSKLNDRRVIYLTVILIVYYIKT